MTSSDNPRVIIAVATEADESTQLIWKQLKVIQANMFALVPSLKMKFAYFGAEDATRIRHCATTNWITNADDMGDMLDRARDRCICGCYVHVNDILEQALQEAQQGPVQAVIIVGDYFRGNIKAALATAKQFCAVGTRLFLFQPMRSDRGVADTKFRILAETTGGASLQFNPYIEQIAEKLPQTIETLAHFAVGGMDALKAQAQQDNESAVLLLEQMSAVPFSIEVGELVTEDRENST